MGVHALGDPEGCLNSCRESGDVRAQRCSEKSHAGDYGDGDEACQNTVFSGGGTVFVCGQAVWDFMMMWPEI